MARSRSSLGNLQHLLEEHSQLRETVELCRLSLNEKIVNTHDLSSLFQKLLEQLLNHFSHEEEHGYFVEVVEAAPQLEHTVEELHQQHPRMVEMIVGILKEVDHAGPGEKGRSSLIHKYEDFVQLFEHHESEETRLLHDTFNSDIGEHD